MLTSLRDILTGAAASLGVEPEVRLLAVRKAWPAVAGARLAAITDPVAVRGGVVVVGVGHPLAAQEVRLRGEALLSALRDALPHLEVSRIQPVIRLGSRGRR